MKTPKSIPLFMAVIGLSLGCAAQAQPSAATSSAPPIYRPAPPPMPMWKQRELMMRGGPKQFPPPASAWFDQERETFTAILAASRASLLVAPVQVHLHGLDRSTRSMMAAQLSAALEPVHQVANPFAVQRALGEGLRRLDRNDLQKLAKVVGATRMLTTYAGHDGQGTLAVTMQSWSYETTTGLWKPGAIVEGRTRMADGEAISTAFQERILPELLASLGAAAGLQRDAPRTASPPAGDWPASFEQALEVAASGAGGESTYHQILGMLSPESPERGRERLFEQSLVALDRADPASADRKLLRARALYYLHSRPAAIEALGKPRNPQEEAFRAFLDGNLPDLQAAVARIEHGVFRVFAEIELRDLQYAYRVPEQAVPAAIAAVKPPWKALVVRRFLEGNGWRVQENAELKQVLDHTVPIAGFDLASTMRGESALGRDIDSEKAGLLVFEHVQRLRRSEAFLDRCPIGRKPCPRAAFVDLVESAAISNAARAISRAAVRQGAYEEADRIARVYAARLDGQPEFAAAQSQSLVYRTMNQARPPGPAQLPQAILAMYYEQGQSRTAFDAVVQGARTPELKPLLDEYLNDLPARWFWTDQVFSEHEPAAQVARARARLRASVADIEAARFLEASLPKDQLAALGSDLAGRFKGHPERASLKSVALAAAPATGPSQGDDARIAAFVSAQSARPDLWPNYRQHGDYLVYEKGALKAAAEAYLRFPGFRQPSGYNPVELSNNAFEGGSMLYYRGDFDGARTLYRIAANLGTGSAASLLGESRLALLDGDFAASAQSSFNVGARYNNAYAIRDYLAWMHVFGFADEAWAAFGRVAPELTNPQAWSAAHVGKRVEGRSEAELRDWLQSEPVRTLGSTQRFALIEAILLNTVDRTPWGDLPEFMRKVEGKPLGRFDSPSHGGGTVMVPAHGGHAPVPRPQLRTANPAFKESEPVPSDLVYFAQAYVPLREGKFAEAADRFAAMAQLYPVEGGAPSPIATGYPLSYYAWASAKSGDKHQLEGFLDKREVRFFQNFDHHLAKAAFTGLRGEHDAAVKHLERAFNYRPHTEDRPIFTEYQFAEMCDWLFDATKEPRYRDLAIRMARINQRVHPFFAWSYAMEAKLSPPGPERTRALGMALYLDPRSERIGPIAEGDKAAARAWFEKNNPFRTREPAKQRVTLRLPR